jgi:hypothetical protein
MPSTNKQHRPENDPNVPNTRNTTMLEKRRAYEKRNSFIALQHSAATGKLAPVE